MKINVKRRRYEQVAALTRRNTASPCAPIFSFVL